MRVPERLTPFQEQAVAKDGGRILLVASAGSGKTEVLTRRVMRHLNESRGETYRILTVTFTVRAAQELQSRLRQGLSEEAWRVDSDTTHGFAFDWLMRFGQVVNIYPDTIVYAEDADRLRMLAELVASLGEDPSDDLRPILRAIDDERTQAPTSEVVSGPAYGSVPFVDLYSGYLAAMDAAGGIDFPGMLTKFLEADNANERFLANFRETYKHVLVDEGQDLSWAQAEVVGRLTRPPVNLFVVADDRQSINGFAGGSFDNVRRLVGRDAVEGALHLPHNFRCATAVLSAAEKLAQHLAVRPKQALGAADAPRGLVHRVEASDPQSEASQAADWVVRRLEGGLDPRILAPGEDPSVAHEEVALIARARWLLDPVLAALRDRDVQVSVQTDSQDYFTSPQARILAEGLAILAQSANAPARRRMLDELRGLDVEGDESHSPLEWLSSSDRSDVSAVAAFLDGLSVGNLMERLAQLAASSDKDLQRDLMVLRSSYQDYCVGVAPQARTLLGFTRHLARSQQTRPTDPGVRVLTIHKVKGLEFRCVCLIAAYDGVIPDYRAKSDRQIDEERRAFYVAMTRASRELMVSSPRLTFDRYGRRHPQAPSRFAREAGLAP